MHAQSLLPRCLATVAISALAAISPDRAIAQDGKLDDPTIIAIFDAANTWDMETGAIAAKKGSNKAVREFGAMLVRDHEVVRQQGRDLVKKLGVRPTPPADFALARNHAAALRTLESRSGKAFDRAFLEHEVAFHKAVLDAMNTSLLPALKNEEARALVSQVAPAFQAHMLAAQALLDRQLE